MLVIKGYQVQLNEFLHEDFFNALAHLLIIVEDYMLYSGKVENIVVIVETSYRSLEDAKLPFKSLEMLFLLLQNNFPCLLDRMYILHPDQSLRQIFEKMKSNPIDPYR